MASYLPLSIPINSTWENVSVSRQLLEGLLDFNATKRSLVPAKQGGLFISATLVLPNADCSSPLLKAARGMAEKDERYAFLFQDHLFQLTGWNYSPSEPTRFELKAISLASLEDLISLLPY